MEKRLLKIGLSVLLIVGFADIVKGMVLVKKGQAKCKIVIDAKTSEIEEFAARELQRYIRKISGVTLPVVRKNKGTRNAIFIGCNEIIANAGVDFRKLEEEEFVIKTLGNSLFLQGGSERATLYSVYAFLEMLGCRWYYPDTKEEVIPKLSTIEIGEIELREKPKFKHRIMSPMYSPRQSKRKIIGLIDWLAKVRMNCCFFALGRYVTDWEGFWEGNDKIASEARKRGVKIGIGGHCWNVFFPGTRDFKDIYAESKKNEMPEFIGNTTDQQKQLEYEAYLRLHFKKHPEYYALVNGKRTFKDGHGLFCTSNPEAVSIFINNIITFLKSHPEIEFFAPWATEDYDFCQCDRCRPVSIGDRYLKLMNLLLKEMRKEKINTELCYLAYAGWISPPEETKPEKGLIVELSPWGRDFRFPLNETPGGGGWWWKLSDIKNWLKVCKNKSPHADFILHEKYCRIAYGLGYHPLPYDTIFKDLKYLEKIGADGLELPSELSNWWAAGLIRYTLARLLWNNYLKKEDIVNDYLDNYYGQASRPMREHFLLFEEAMPEFHYGSKFQREYYIRTPDMSADIAASFGSFYRQKVEGLRKCERYLKEAKSLAQRDKVVLSRIKKAEMAFQHVKNQMNSAMCQYEALATIGKNRWLATGQRQSWRNKLQKAIQWEEQDRALHHKGFDCCFWEEGIGAHVINRRLGTPNRRSIDACRKLMILGTMISFKDSYYRTKEKSKGNLSQFKKELKEIKRNFEKIEFKLKNEPKEFEERYERYYWDVVKQFIEGSVIDKGYLYPILPDWREALAFWEKTARECDFKNVDKEIEKINDSLKELKGERYKIVTLENKYIRVDIIPDLGGRIYRMIDKTKGIDYLYVPETIKVLSSHWADYGGYEEYSTNAYHAPGWNEEYKYEIIKEKGEKKIRLSSLLSNDYLLTRVISIKDDARELKISSKLKNTNSQIRESRLRVHPIFATGNLKDNVL